MASMLSVNTSQRSLGSAAPNLVIAGMMEISNVLRFGIYNAGRSGRTPNFYFLVR